MSIGGKRSQHTRLEGFIFQRHARRGGKDVEVAYVPVQGVSLGS